MLHTILEFVDLKMNITDFFFSLRVVTVIHLTYTFEWLIPCIFVNYTNIIFGWLEISVRRMEQVLSNDKF